MNQFASEAPALSIYRGGRLTIRSVTTEVVDLPIRRPHQFSKARITTQAYLIVEILAEEGPIGLGEDATPGEPW